jgi:hypothetical protein
LAGKVGYMSESNISSLERQHAHRIPDQEAQRKLRELREETYFLAQRLNQHCPPGRELALAQIKLDEVRMWACNAITMGGEIKERLNP